MFYRRSSSYGSTTYNCDCYNTYRRSGRYVCTTYNYDCCNTYRDEDDDDDDEEDGGKKLHWKKTVFAWWIWNYHCTKGNDEDQDDDSKKSVSYLVRLQTLSPEHATEK